MLLFLAGGSAVGRGGKTKQVSVRKRAESQWIDAENREKEWMKMDLD